jgi:hypothetical protein
MEFRELTELSPQLNTAITGFIDRLDMNGRDRELFYDIVRFAFDEGKLTGKEIILKDINENGKTIID